MEEYLIKPWDTRQGSEPTPVDWDMNVPPEVDAIADKVIKQYDMSVSNRTLITSKPDKGGAIWRIETNKGPRSLKVLHRTPERSLFSVGLQEYVVKQGARVPALIPAKDGKLYVEMGGKLWIVTDWISLQPATKVDLVGAQELCYGLGEFHRHTKGYLPPLGARNSSRLYKWPNYFQKIVKKIGWMREMATAYKDTAASGPILAVVDEYERQAIEALNRLQASAYPKMVAMGAPYWGLVHQDYGWSNGQNGPGGLWVIDLDGVAYDLPFRDLRKLITSTCDDMGVWDLTWIRGMIDAYHQANPLDAESFEVLLIDMALPNEFYKHLKEMFFDPVTFLNTEAGAILQRVVSADKSKWQALSDLSKDMTKYKSGNYEQAAAAKISRPVASEGAWDQQSWVLQPQKSPAASSEDTRVDKQWNEKKKTISLPAFTELVPISEERKPAKEKRSRSAAVIDISPYLKKKKAKSAKLKKAGTTKEIKPGKTSKEVKLRKTIKEVKLEKTNEGVLTKRNTPSSKPPKSAVTPLKRKAKKSATKTAPKLRRTIAKQGQRAASLGRAKKAAAPKKHAYTKVAAPSRKVTKSPARKPRAKKGIKSAGGLR